MTEIAGKDPWQTSSIIRSAKDCQVLVKVPKVSKENPLINGTAGAKNPVLVNQK